MSFRKNNGGKLISPDAAQTSLFGTRNRIRKSPKPGQAPIQKHSIHNLLLVTLCILPCTVMELYATNVVAQDIYLIHNTNPLLHFPGIHISAGEWNLAGTSAMLKRTERATAARRPTK